eukprot:EG_transcript_27879
MGRALGVGHSASGQRSPHSALTCLRHATLRFTLSSFTPVRPVAVVDAAPAAATATAASAAAAAPHPWPVYRWPPCQAARWRHSNRPRYAPGRRRWCIRRSRCPTQRTFALPRLRHSAAGVAPLPR